MAKEAKKCKEFSRTFIALGAELRLANAAKQIVEVANVPGRANELRHTAEEVIAADYVSAGQVSHLRGRFLHTAAQVCGIIAVLAMKQLFLRESIRRAIQARLHTYALSRSSASFSSGSHSS